MSVEGQPVRLTESQEFAFSERLGSIQGLLEGLVTRSNRSEETVVTSVDQVVTSLSALSGSSMAAKNKLTFSGRQTESAEDFIKELKYLQLANGWSDGKMLGNALVSLQGDAKKWFQRQGEVAFIPAGGTAMIFTEFETKFLERFKEDLNESDIISDILSMRQTRGQSVDDYLTAVFKKLAKLSDISEEVKVGLVVNGFLPGIKDNLKLKEIKTLCDLELWSRRMEKLSFVQKSSVHSIDEAEIDAISDESQTAPRKSSHKTNQYVPPARTVNRRYQTPSSSHFSDRRNGGTKFNRGHGGGSPQYPTKKQGPCWTCGGPHLQRMCQARSDIRPGRNSSFQAYRGMGKGRSYSNQYYDAGPSRVPGRQQRNSHLN